MIRGYLSSMEKISKAMASLGEPNGQRSNRKLIEQFKNINILEAIQKHNELNNSLKPYDSDIIISSISWIGLKELIYFLAAIITIYMFWVSLPTTPLEKKDLDEMFIKQQFNYKKNLKSKINT